MLNKTTFSSLLLIGSLLFLFFNENGIKALMEKQSSVRKQKSKNEKLRQEINKLIKENEQFNALIDPNNTMDYEEIIRLLNDLRKEKGITLDNEYYYLIEEE